MIAKKKFSVLAAISLAALFSLESAAGTAKALETTSPALAVSSAPDKTAATANGPVRLAESESVKKPKKKKKKRKKKKKKRRGSFHG